MSVIWSKPQSRLSMTQACLTWNLPLPAKGFDMIRQ